MREIACIAAIEGYDIALTLSKHQLLGRILSLLHNIFSRFYVFILSFDEPPVIAIKQFNNGSG